MFSQAEYDALLTGAGLLDRTSRGRLRLTGADRRSYLHGLLTNDIDAVGPGQGCYAALLTPQGRMISDMRVSELGTAVLIDLPGATAATVHDRLANFVFSEDVVVEDVTAALAQVGLYGPAAARLVASVVAHGDGKDAVTERLDGLVLNANVTGAFEGDPLWIVRSDDYGVAGFELFVVASAAGALVRALTGAGAVQVTSASADVVRVESGRPEFGIDMDEHTIPLEAGIEDRAISLTKGCYVGQEIIIRVLHRGQGRVAKRLVRFVADPASEIRRGDQISDDGKDVGAVTSAVTSPRLGRIIGLGYVHRDHSEAGRVLGVGTRSITVTDDPSIPSL
jgi:tRNA-modifying protein YgfZ